MFGTIDCITVCTVASSIGVAAIGSDTNISAVIGAYGTLSSSVARR